MTVTGQKQGQFKREGTQKGDWIPIQGFFMGLTSPRDASSGQASGKRQYKPVTIIKEWGAASPQGLTACATNEVLTSVTIEFVKTNQNGQQYVFQTVKLTDATISDISRFAGDLSPNDGASTWHFASTPNALELEHWSFTFRKIEVDDADGKTTFTDDWAVRA